MMISTTNSKLQPGPSQDSGLCVLVPARHLKLPLFFLKSGKHLIGTDPSCAIQLVAEGIQKRHSLIVVGQQKIILKAFDARTWVNDHATAEAVLRVGDRVSIGPITFQLRRATTAEIADLDQSVAGDTVSPALTDLPKESGIEVIEPPDVAKPISQEIVDVAGADFKTSDIATSIERPAIEQVPETVLPDDVDDTVVTMTPLPRAVLSGLSQRELKELLVNDHSQAPQEPPQSVCSGLATLGHEALLTNVSGSAPQEVVINADLASRQNELLKRAADLDCRSREMQLQMRQIADHQDELDRERELFALEKDKFEASVQASRRELADEHARNAATWKDWNASHNRASDELNRQLTLLEQLRDEIEVSNEQAIQERAAIQDLQRELTVAQQEVDSERDRIDSERDALLAQAAELQVQQETHATNSRSVEARLDEDQNSLSLAKEELGASRQQLEQESARLADERARLDSEGEALRARSAEFESLRQQHQIELRDREAQIADSHRDLSLAQGELSTTQQQVEEQLARLTDERARLDSEGEALRARSAEIEQLRQQLQLQEIESRDHEAQIAEDRLGLTLAQEELDASRQKLEQDCARLVDERARLDSEREALRTQSSEFELLCQQHQIELRNHEAQIAEDRRGLNLVQAAVDTHREQNEQQIARLADERAYLDSERDTLRTQSAKFELLQQRHEIESRDRETQIAEDRRVLSLAQTEFSASRLQHEQELARLAEERARLDSEREALRTQSAEFETLRQQHLIELRDREALMAEDRCDLGLAQGDLGATRQEFDEEFARLADEKDRLASEREALRTQSAEFENLRQKHFVESRDREAQIDEDRRALVLAEADLLATRQQIELDRTRLASERSADSVRREQEQQELANARLRLNEDEAAIRKSRIDLEATEQELNLLRIELQQKAEELAAARSELESLRNRLDQEAVTFEAKTLSDLSGLAGDQSNEATPLEADNRTVLRPHSNFHTMLTPPEDEFPFENRIPGSGVYDTYKPSSAGIRDPFSTITRDQAALNVAIDSVSFDTRIIANLDQKVGSTKSQIDSLREIQNVTDEQTFTDSNLETVADNLTSAVQTLSVVNQHFGSLLSKTELDSNLIHDPVNLSQSSFVGSNGEFADPSQAGVLNDASTMPNFDQPVANNEDNSISSLRAQLAQMFNLSEDPASSFALIEELDPGRQSGTPQESNPVDGSSSDSIEPFPLQMFSIDQLATESMTAPRQQSTDLPLVNPDGKSAMTETADVSMNESETDDPWTQRLRQLSMVAERSPAPPPIPPTPITTEPEPTESDDEYSVEAQLARLLGRPLNPPKQVVNPPKAAVVEVVEDVAAPDRAEADSASLPDRSHLTDEPRHKQNKSAVREEVQSFRAVARMSARTALAKHSWNNLRNEIYFKVGLTAASAGATIWFVGNYFYGHGHHVWFGLACGMATVVCLSTLIRAYSQLKKGHWRNTQEHSLLSSSGTEVTMTDSTPSDDPGE